MVLILMNRNHFNASIYYANVPSRRDYLIFIPNTATRIYYKHTLHLSVVVRELSTALYRLEMPLFVTSFIGSSLAKRKKEKYMAGKRAVYAAGCVTRGSYR